MAEKNPLRNSRGQALLYAILIMAVLTILGSALLMTAYSLYQEARDSVDADKNNEYVLTLSRMLEADIAGQEEADAQKHPLRTYLAQHLWTQEWPYYDGTEGHEKETSQKTFSLEGNIATENLYGLPKETIDNLRANTRIVLYYEPARYDEQGQPVTEESRLYVTAVYETDSRKDAVTFVYELETKNGERRDWRFRLADGR